MKILCHKTIRVSPLRNAAWMLPAAILALAPLAAGAQTTTNLAAFRLLSPVSALGSTSAGRAALAANLKVTGGIQRGEIILPTLVPLAEQRGQALRDAYITGANLAQLADGLGSTLGAGYNARYHYDSKGHATKLPDSVERIVRYAESTSGRDSGAAKYFFANLTQHGKTPVSDEAKAIMTKIGGQTDIFGKTYHFPAGAAGAGKYGDARPFQTEPSITDFTGKDYLNRLATVFQYNHGPFMDLINSPSFPSGHTTYGYTGSLILALCFPERYQQMIARGAEYGTDRIFMGSHYAMDVLGGRTVALYDMAHLLANDPAYTGVSSKKEPAIKDFRSAFIAARAELRKSIESACGDTIEACAGEDISRFSDLNADAAFYESTQTYGLPVVFEKVSQTKEDVAKLAPEAGYLLTVAFPKLTLQEADQILTDTEGPGGRFLDNGSSYGVYSRLDLFAAAGKAAEAAKSK